jgi:triphosphoribosyl-dephospho-CoA synthase
MMLGSALQFRDGAGSWIDASAIAEAARSSLIEELETWPKPGLVSHVDNGSHNDMDANTLRSSIEAITPYFGALAQAGAQGAAMGRLRRIGLDAEAAMLRATGTVNTHRGTIFGMGLLCAAAGRRSSGMVRAGEQLGRVVARVWGEGILGGPVLPHSHGQRARLRYGAGGARQQAAEGFPCAYEIGIPALAEGEWLSRGDAEAARVHATFALIAVLEDTNLLHRGGPAGLSFARAATAEFLKRGGIGRPDWLADAAKIHAAFTARHLSPGGAADLLAMRLFLARMEGRPACIS